MTTEPPPDGAHGPRPLDRRSPLPLWAQLFDDLRRRMETGEFSAEFPAEHRLTGEYEVTATPSGRRCANCAPTAW